MGFGRFLLKFGLVVGLGRWRVLIVWLGRLFLAILLWFGLVGMIILIGGSLEFFKVGVVLNNLP
jgi:hypothetical protein